MRAFVVSMGVLLSGVVQAQGESAPPLVTKPNWSVGAGIGLGESGFALAGLSGLLGGLGGVSSAYVSTPRLSFERLLSERVALVFGLAANHQAGVLPVFLTSSEPGGVLQRSTSSSSAALSVGPRWVVTTPQSPIAVSVFAMASAGYATLSYGDAGEEPQGAHSFLFGILGGLAIERMLIDRLALRIQTQIISANFARRFEQTTLTPTVLGSARTYGSAWSQVSVVPLPSVELRLYF